MDQIMTLFSPMGNSEAPKTGASFNEDLTQVLKLFYS